MTDERQIMIERNIGLVYKFATKFVPSSLRKYWGGKDELVADLFQPYVNATDKWLDSDRKLRISTYAYKGMWWFILRELPYRRLIYVPACTPKRIALRRWKELITSAKIVMFSRLSQNTTDVCFAFEPESYGEQIDNAQMVAELFRCNLTQRERQVIRMRFGFFDGSPMTLEQCAKFFSVTRERIRQVEIRALLKMWNHSSRIEIHKMIEQQLKWEQSNKNEERKLGDYVLLPVQRVS